MMPPVMMQSMPTMPPMGAPIQFAPAVQIYPPQIHLKRKQELSTSAAAKTGAVFVGGLTAIRQIFSAPATYEEGLEIANTKLPNLARQLSPKGLKSASVVATILSSVMITGFAAGFAALVGGAGASTYNHFARKENTRPRYYA